MRGLAGAGLWGSPVVGSSGVDGGLEASREAGPLERSGAELRCGSPRRARHRRELRGRRQGKARSLLLAWDRGSERVPGWLEPRSGAGRGRARCRSRRRLSLGRAPGDGGGDECIGGAARGKGHGAGGGRASSGGVHAWELPRSAVTTPET